MHEHVRSFGGVAFKVIGAAGVLFSIFIGVRQCAGEGKLHATIVAGEFKSPPISGPKRAKDSTTDANAALEFDPLDPLTSYLNVRVVNDGGREVKQVFLRVPNGAYACVQREAVSRWTCLTPAGVIPIGDLQGSESARVLVWQSFFGSLKEIRLTYSEGVGSIRFETVAVPQGLLREIEVPLAGFAVLVLLTVWFVTADAAQWRRRALEQELKQRQEDALERKRAEYQGQL